MKHFIYTLEGETRLIVPPEKPIAKDYGMGSVYGSTWDEEQAWKKAKQVYESALLRAFHEGQTFEDQVMVLHYVLWSLPASIASIKGIKDGLYEVTLPEFVEVWQRALKAGDPVWEDRPNAVDDSDEDKMFYEYRTVLRFLSESPAEKKEGLLACPFCGEAAEWINKSLGDNHWYIRCSNGHCRVTIKADRKDKAEGLWNQRVSDSVQPEEQEMVQLLRWFEREKDAGRIEATKGYDELVKQFLTRRGAKE